MRTISKIVIAFLLVSFTQLSAQDNGSIMRKNTIAAESGGHSSFAALKYERILFQKDRVKLAAGTGLGFTAERLYQPIIINIPVEAAFLYGNSHNLEAGIGYSAHFKWRDDYDTQERMYHSHYNLIQYKVGYRYQADEDNRGISVSAAINVVTLIDDKPGYTLNDFPVLPSVAVGYCF